jgi:hypothetical protein
VADRARQELVSREFEERKRQREEEAEAKTAKNRAKRQKKKERAKAAKATEGGAGGAGGGQAAGAGEEQTLKKRRVVNGKEVLFRRPGEESDEEGSDEEGSDEEYRGGDDGDGDGEEPGPRLAPATVERELATPSTVPIAETPSIVIHEDD